MSCVPKTRILRPHKNPWRSVIRDILQRGKPRTHALHSSEGVEPGFNAKSGFFLFLSLPWLSGDFQGAGTACVRAQGEAAGSRSLSNSPRSPLNLSSSLQMKTLNHGEVNWWKKIRRSSVWHRFCSARCNMAQQFTVKLCSYPLRIRGGTAALYSCTGRALYNAKGCQLHHHPCNGAPWSCAVHNPHGWINGPGWERQQSLKPAVQNSPRCTFQKTHQAPLYSQQRECLSTLPRCPHCPAPSSGHWSETKQDELVIHPLLVL